MNSRGIFIVLLGLILAFAGCSRHDGERQALLDKLAHAPASDLPPVLYGYEQSSAGAQKILLNMLGLLHAPSPDQKMELVEIRQSGRFSMIVVRAPWLEEKVPSTVWPILVTEVDGVQKVVGYVLPFDDIWPLIPATDKSDIYELAGWWADQKANGAWKKE